MKKRTLAYILGGLCVLCLLLAGGAWYYVQSHADAIMAQVASKAETKASDALGVPVELGEIQVISPRELAVNNIAIYDKQADCIARAQKAQVKLRLLSVFQAKDLLAQPAEAVEEVTLSGVDAVLREREDGSWNVEDLQSESSGETTFHGRVTFADSQLTLQARGIEEKLTDASGKADFSAYPVLKVQVQGKNHDSHVEASGTLGKAKQIVNLRTSDVDLANYFYLLDLLPEGTVPQDVVLQGGRVPQLEAHVLNRRGAPLSLTGTADFEDVALQVKDTPVEHITGHAQFTQRDVLLQATAEAAGQQVAAHGKVTLDTGSPCFDIYAQSDSFDPSQVLRNVPVSGAASFDAHLTGTVADPIVEGTVQLASGSAMGIALQNASARVRLLGQHIYVQDLQLQVLGGQVTGEAEAVLTDQSYTGHLKVQDLDVAQAAQLVPALAAESVTGKATADVGFSGTGTDFANMTAYGSARVRDGSLHGIPLEDVSTSFSLQGQDITIDYLSANLPHRSSLGLEGQIRAGQELDLAFYGGHMDLTLANEFLQQIVPQAEITGLGDFQGTVQGSLANPQVELKFSAMHGTFFKQPFDSLKITAGGSLDGVHVDDFMLEKDGQQTWFVQGTVGFAGGKKLDLRIDTKGARMEDIASLIAPDQPITGNVDNVIQLKGTLDNPEGVGYIHFYRGSYAGVLLSGMDGDYFLNNGVVRLQDFHLFSPMVDAVLNGTIDLQRNLNMVVRASDLDFSRFQHKLPYAVSGHGRFEGQIKGTLAAPEFYGVLDAPSLIINGQQVDQLNGHVQYRNDQVSVDRFGFVQNDGSYDMELSFNRVSRALKGTVVMQNADVNALAAICNYRNDKLQGRLSAGLDLDGTLDSPHAVLHGELAKGSVAGCDVHDVALAAHLLDNVLYVDKLQGQQGEVGVFGLQGTVTFNEPLVEAGNAPLDGAIKGTLSAQNMDLGLFAGLADASVQAVGQADVEAALGGWLRNPTVDATLRARDGGVKGSTFDTLSSVLHLKNGQIDIDTLNVQKAVGQQTYQFSAEGVVPLRALQATQAQDEANDVEQIMLNVSLDHADLSLLPVFAPSIEWAVGATQGSLTIRGTAANPRIDGSITVPDGGMKLKALEKPLTNLHLQADFNGHTMTLKDVSAKMGDGLVKGTGHATLAGLKLSDYQLDLQADQLDIQSDFFRGPLTGDLHLSEGEIWGFRMPKLSGQVDFHDCQISVPTIPDTEGSLPHILLDMQVNVGRKVHAYSPYLYDLFLTGQVHFGGTTRHPLTSGTLDVKRGGTVNYLKTVFKIDEGAAYFNQVDSFLPSIHFAAQTRLTQAKVFLTLDGPLDAMKISLTSSPEMSQTEIIQLLTLRNAYKAGKQIDAGDLLNVGLQMSFLSEVEGVMRKMLWLDDFTIARGSGSIVENHDRSRQDDDENVYNVEMGKYIGDKLMLKYTQGIGDDVRRYGLQYDMDDRYSFTLENQDSETIVGAQVKVRF